MADSKPDVIVETATDSQQTGKQTGPRTDADVLKDVMQDVTPPSPTILPDQIQGTPSRTNVGRDAFNATGSRERANITRLIYQGRKDSEGDLMENQVRGEHIDVTVPDPNSNKRRVNNMKFALNMGALTDEDKVKAGLNLMDPRLLHVRGQHYHFEQGQATDVYNEDVEWLKDHETYIFTEAPPPQNPNA